jgi:signal transduction histidine kinase/GAF domain-containing protein/CheY-like chemotaxis protein
MKLTLIEPQIWALDSAISSIIGVSDMDQLLNTVLQKASYGMGAQAGVILFLASDTEDSQMRVYKEGQLWAEKPDRLNQKVIRKVVQSAAPLIWEHIKDFGPSLLGIDLDWQPESVAYIPLMVEDRVLGLLGLASAVPRFFQKRGISWFSFWGKQLGLAIHKVQLEWKLNKSRQETASLSEISTIMGYSLELDDMLHLVLDKILKLFEVESGGIYILDEQDKKLRLAASSGLPDFLKEGADHEHEHNGFKNQILQSAEPLLVNDLSQAREADEILRQSGYHCFVGVPIRSEKRVLGLISLLSKQERRKFSPSEVEFLCTVGNRIATIIENNILFDQLVCAKNEWETTFDYITDMVAILDQDLTILRANKTLAAKFNKHPRSIVGSKCYELFHANGSPPPDCPGIKTLATGKPCTREIRIPELESTYLLSTSIIPSRDGRAYLSYIARDITAHKKLEHQLLQMQKMECIGNLAGGIAHDFNNLLEGILGYAYYIKQKMPKDDPLYGEVEAIENIAIKGANLTHQLMDFARRGEVKLIPVSVNDMVCEVKKLLSRTIHKNIIISEHLEPGLPLVRGDEGQIQQLILNICLNARDAMPKGGKLKISTERVVLDEEITEINPWAEPGEYIRLSIADTGCGMDSVTQDKIFDPFFTTKKHGQGTGLGLSSVYRLVKKHQGHIQVKSKMGQGTAFEVFLPVWKKKEKPASKAAETILIVDQEEMIRKKAQKVLLNKGYKVLVAGNDQAAMDIINKQGKDIDLIILDLVPSETDGDQAYKLLQQIKSNIRVLLSSNRNLSKHPPKAINRHSAGILQKPYQPRDLLQQVKKVLGK